MISRWEIFFCLDGRNHKNPLYQGKTMFTWLQIRKHRLVKIGCCLFYILSPLLQHPGVFADPPPGYYDSTAGLTGASLRQALHDIIDDHTRVSYSNSVRDILKEADQDPDNTSNILDIYKNESHSKSADGNTWNIEHSWPKSYGFPNNNDCNYPYSDCHHLFACDSSYNSSRGNNPYDNCLSDCEQKPVTGFPNLFNLRSGSGSTGTWEVWEHRKGDVARALFYLDVRYEGGTHGETSCEEPDLILTDNRSYIQASDINYSPAYMGILSTLLKWHALDPVDDKERHRNDVVYGYQGNRNPFIDHPKWVEEIWEIVTPTPTATPVIGIGEGDIVLNEIDYDDPGLDSQSFIELKNISGKYIDLSDLEIIGISQGSTTYCTYCLEEHLLSHGEYWVLGTADDSDEVSGYIDETMKSVSSIQNGDNDGIYLRLADGTGTIIDSVSYEGATSHPIGSSDSGNAGEDDSGSDFKSLSRVPDGVDTNDNASDFTFKDATPGEPNSAPTPTPTASPTSSSSPTPTPTTTPEINIDPGDIILNEIDYDNPGIDMESFIELKNASEKSINLSFLEIMGFNSNTPETPEYFSYQLGSQLLAPDEYWVLGTRDDSSSVTAFLDETMHGVRSLQNGPDDGIFLRLRDIPGMIIDSVSYEGEGGHPEGSPDSGDAGSDSTAEVGISLSRLPDGRDTGRNDEDFSRGRASPGKPNEGLPTPTPTPGFLPTGLIIH